MVHAPGAFRKEILKVVSFLLSGIVCFSIFNGADWMPKESGTKPHFLVLTQEDFLCSGCLVFLIDLKASLFKIIHCTIVHMSTSQDSEDQKGLFVKTSPMRELLASTLSVNGLQEVGRGVYSTVFKIDGQNLVVKVPAPMATAHHEVERRIYERIQHHPHILKYYGEIDIYKAYSGSSTEPQSNKGLVFEYLSRGSLWRTWREAQQFPGLERRYEVSSQ